MAELPSPDQLLGEIIADAKRVAAYGQRTGRLKDYELLTAIAAMDPQAPASWSAPQTATLQAALNRAVQAISPVTIADLRGGFDPFDEEKDPVKKKQQARFQATFVAITVALMFLTAIATWDYNNGSALIVGVEKLQQEDPRSVVAETVRQLLAANTLVLKTNPDANGETSAERLLDEPRYGLLDKLHQIDADLRFFVPRAVDFTASHRPLHEAFGNWLTTVWGNLSRSGQVTAASVVDLSVINGSSYGEYDPCAERAQRPPRYITAFADTVVAGELDSYSRDYLEIVCGENLYMSRENAFKLAESADAVRSWAKLQGQWFLPALYGALGAALYYMRRILDPTLPDPPFARIFHRVALGGFAGIVVTWFWAPDLLGAEGLKEVGITTFTLAFIVGFSIEVLFAVLDRLVNSMAELARGAGKQPAPMPEIK